MKEERESPVEDTPTRGLLLWEADVQSCSGHLEEQCARASELSPTPSWGPGHPFTSSHLPPLEGCPGGRNINDFISGPYLHADGEALRV